MPTQDDATIREATDTIQTLMAALSGLFSFSSSSDASYLISSLLSQLSQLLAQITTGNYDKAEVRTQLLSSLDGLEKLPSVMGRNAPAAALATLQQSRANLLAVLNNMIHAPVAR
jgi:hypothetical protein